VPLADGVEDVDIPLLVALHGRYDVQYLNAPACDESSCLCRQAARVPTPSSSVALGAAS
jgi:hypothetical protein